MLWKTHSSRKVYLILKIYIIRNFWKYKNHSSSKSALELRKMVSDAKRKDRNLFDNLIFLHNISMLLERRILLFRFEKTGNESDIQNN